jgi:hypothetical protein
VRFLAATLVVVAAVFALSACAPADEPSRIPWDAPATAELERRAAEDQALRERLVATLQSGGAPDSALLAELAAADSANAAWLAAAVATHGWPARTSAGDAAATAAFLIVQHASHDTLFQGAMFRELSTAFDRGEADGESLALLTDRVARHRGSPQLYGTQAELRDGRVVLDPIADSAGVDARRARLGLMPLDTYVRFLDSVYTAQPRE